MAKMSHKNLVVRLGGSLYSCQLAAKLRCRDMGREQGIVERQFHGDIVSNRILPSSWQHDHAAQHDHDGHTI